MRKASVTLWIFALLFAISASSFGESISYEGPIQGLVFSFDKPGLPLDSIGMTGVSIRFAHVQGTGREHIVITPSGQYNYYAKLDGDDSIIYAWSTDVWTKVKGFDEYGNPVKAGGKPILPDIGVPIESAELSECFRIEGPVPEDPLDIVVPDDVSLYFRATLAPEYGSVKFALKINHGRVQFVRP